MGDLMLRATEELLAGWCGPVVLKIADIPHPVRAVWWAQEEEAYDGGLCWGLEEASFHLDLSRAECRDRVARVVAEHRRAPCGLSWTWGYAGAIGGWMLEARLPTTRIHDQRAHGEAFCAQPDFDSWGSFPALAALNPRDDTRLPDGSRLVDAQALLAVAKEVLHD